MGCTLSGQVTEEFLGGFWWLGEPMDLLVVKQRGGHRRRNTLRRSSSVCVRQVSASVFLPSTFFFVFLPPFQADSIIMFLNIIRSSGVPRRFHQLLDNPTGAQSDPSRAAAVISTGLVTQANAYHSRCLSAGPI